jgi:hypothetical protein
VAWSISFRADEDELTGRHGYFLGRIEREKAKETRREKPITEEDEHFHIKLPSQLTPHRGTYFVCYSVLYHVLHLPLIFISFGFHYTFGWTIFLFFDNQDVDVLLWRTYHIWTHRFKYFGNNFILTFPTTMNASVLGSKTKDSFWDFWVSHSAMILTFVNTSSFRLDN